MKKILTGAFAFILFAVTAQAQSRDTVRNHKGKHDMIVNHVGLSEAQKAKLKSIHEAQRSEMKELKKSSLSPDEQKVKKEELHNKYKAQVQAVYTPEQKVQMEKMKKQWKADGKKGKKTGKKDGVSKRKHANGSMKGNDVVKELNLTPEQKEKMETLRKESRSQFQSVRNDKNLTEEQKKSRMKELKKQQHEQLSTILTPSQIQKMKSHRKERSQRNTR